MPLTIVVEIVRKLPDQVGFAVLLRRPLRGLRHAAGALAGSFGVRFESDFKKRAFCITYTVLSSVLGLPALAGGARRA